MQKKKRKSRPSAPSQDIPVSPETYSVVRKGLAIARIVQRRNGTKARSTMSLETSVGRQRLSQDQLSALFDRAFLKKRSSLPIPKSRRAIRVVDLFSSCGLMTLGVREACQALRSRLEVVRAIDVAEDALSVYSTNFGPNITVQASIADLLDRSFGDKPSESERSLVRAVSDVDVVLAGPPCQGHSNLNNVTRRADPKNKLYERVARFAELVLPNNIIIENVPDVLYDKGQIVDRTFQELLALGYLADHGIVDIGRLGVPQSRKRHILIASLSRQYSVAKIAALYRRPIRTIKWAIGDLVRPAKNSVIDSAAKPTRRSLLRINRLFDDRLYELPNRFRPKCHKTKVHTYNSVYGRLRWNRPSQTITGGFGCMGQGRFVHPSQRRTITPHEAARLQFIPDFFSFAPVEERTLLAELIGNAVPPKLTYVFALEVLR